jgi:4'-phosphopantetheinyl transferase
LAHDIVFDKGEHGKPMLLHGRLNFNISHSGHFCVLAFSKSMHVGVDVEQRDLATDIFALAQRCFVAEEYALFLATDEKKIEMFYWLWTRKEALLKALGIGLQGLHEYSVIENCVVSQLASKMQLWYIYSF